MKTYITRVNGLPLRDPLQYRQSMILDIAIQLGCMEMGIYCYNADSESYERLSSRLDGIIAGINRGDLVICQFPTGNGKRFEYELVNRLKAYGGRIAIYIHELEALAWKEKEKQVGEITGLFNLAEVLIVQTYAMRNWLLEHGIRKSMKFVIQEMWDYTVQMPMVHTPVLKKEIYFTDNEDFAGMNSWNYVVLLKLYNVSANAGQNVQNLGKREPWQLLSELSEGGFGLVWYRDEHSRQYMEQSISFSFARYLAAGIPVIVPSEISHRAIIEANHLGLVVNTLEEAVTVVEKMTEAEYQEYTKAVEQFAPALRNGYYVKKCLIKTMQAFYRKDVGEFPPPTRVCKLGVSVFHSTIVKESYGGNLALSWSFKGYTEGFLIYDNKGNLIFKTDNIHQHYYVINESGADIGFLVKAYVETLKGMLIVAESVLTYLDKGRYIEEPKVTLVIPAYNAENYIARSIDNALAQSLLDLEIIIVDDGSTDETGKIIDWYAEKYANVRTIHQKNSGPAVARNEGIMAANGEYIGFMDSDDMIHPDMMARLYHSAKRNDCDIAVTSAYQITNNGYEVWIQYQMNEDIAVPIEDFLQMHYIPSCGFGLIVWNKIYRASLVKEHLIPPFVGEEDVAWTPYILSYANKVCYLNDCAYEWDRTIRDSTMGIELGRKPKEERFRGYRDVIMFYMGNCNPKRRDLIKQVAMTHLSNLAIWYEYPEYEELRKHIDRIF